MSLVCESRHTATSTASENLYGQKNFTPIGSYVCLRMHLQHLNSIQNKEKIIIFLVGFSLYSNCSWISVINIVYSTIDNPHTTTTTTHSSVCVISLDEEHPMRDSILFSFLLFFVSAYLPFVIVCAHIQIYLLAYGMAMTRFFSPIFQTFICFGVSVLIFIVWCSNGGQHAIDHHRRHHHHHHQSIFSVLWKINIEVNMGRAFYIANWWHAVWHLHYRIEHSQDSPLPPHTLNSLLTVIKYILRARFEWTKQTIFWLIESILEMR